MIESNNKPGPKQDYQRALAIIAAVASFTSGAHAAPTIGDLVPILEHLFPNDAPFTYSKAKRMVDYAIEMGLVAYEDKKVSKSRRLVLTLFQDES